MNHHEKYMARCITLALKGAGNVAPNPMVGAVLVHDNRIIGEGYHQEYGSAHAEVNCFASIAPEDENLIKDAVLYVSLEPCAHVGKTPACSNLIIQKGVKKVVIGCRDPFEAVNGQGIEQLKMAGIEVLENVFNQECLELNRRFFTFHLLKRPYIILKWAQTADGKIAANDNRRLYISNAVSNTLVHRWRTEESGILIGTNTAIKDNPALTNRLWEGKPPLRLVIDTRLQLSSNQQLMSDGLPVVIYNFLRDHHSGPVIYKQVREDRDLLLQILQDCFERNLLSIIVEGGANLLQQFIDAGLWDEARVITNSQLFVGEGLSAPLLHNGIIFEEINWSDDQLVCYRRL